MSPRRASFVCAWTLIVALAGCKKPDGIVCDPPVNPTCPAVVPSFANDVYQNVFVPFCVSCHSADGGVESSSPLTTYAQIYGQNGTEAGAIFTQVIENCRMPPPNADAQLTGGDGDGGDAAATVARQTLLDWLVCGAPNN